MRKNILHKTSCYLIGNLETENYEDAKNWRDQFKNDVNYMGIICYSPLDKVLKNFDFESYGLKEQLQKYIRNRDLNKAREYKNIRRRDLALVDHSTFIVCVLDSQKPTFGTLEELSQADRSQKPVFIVVKGGIENTPIWLIWMFDEFSFYDTLNDVIADLDLIDQGKVDLDPKYWKIFEDSYKV